MIFLPLYSAGVNSIFILITTSYIIAFSSLQASNNYQPLIPGQLIPTSVFWQGPPLPVSYSYVYHKEKVSSRGEDNAPAPFNKKDSIQSFQ